MNNDYAEVEKAILNSINKERTTQVLLSLFIEKIMNEYLTKENNEVSLELIGLEIPLPYENGRDRNCDFFLIDKKNTKGYIVELKVSEKFGEEEVEQANIYKELIADSDCYKKIKNNIESKAMEYSKYAETYNVLNDKLPEIDDVNKIELIYICPNSIKTKIKSELFLNISDTHIISFKDIKDIKDTYPKTSFDKVESMLVENIYTVLEEKGSIKEENYDEEIFKSLFKNLISKALEMYVSPKCQSERIIELILYPFIIEIIRDHFKLENRELELEMEYKLIYKYIERTADYIVFDNSTNTAYIIELKVDSNSIDQNKKQKDDYIKLKENYLNWKNQYTEFKNINNIKIVYILPDKTKEMEADIEKIQLNEIEISGDLKQEIEDTLDYIYYLDKGKTLTLNSIINARNHEIEPKLLIVLSQIYKNEKDRCDDFNCIAFLKKDHYEDLNNSTIVNYKSMKYYRYKPSSNQKNSIGFYPIDCVNYYGEIQENNNTKKRNLKNIIPWDLEKCLRCSLKKMCEGNNRANYDIKSIFE